MPLKERKFWLFDSFEGLPAPTKEDGDVPALKIHRQVACTIELPLLKKMAKAEVALGDRIRDRHWTADWEDCKKHHDLAEKYLTAGALADAFREFCRAVRPLSEAVQRQRQKEDGFPPMWDRSEG